MKTIVLTGATRGIGYGLAQAFLTKGCQVAICGHTQEAVEQAARALAGSSTPEQILGVACDVTEPEQVQSLWDRSWDYFGKIDIWINNAGIGGEPVKIWETSPASARQVVETNLLGTIYGTQTAVRGMLAQGGGDVYIMEGMGADGRRHGGMTFYGMTKYGLDYFFRSLVEETKNSSIRVGALQPGMVITDLVTGPYVNRPQEWERVKKVFNIIADRVENVAPWLAEAILNNQRHGAVLAYSSPVKLIWRFLSAPISKRDLFANNYK
jgi:NAD(P)-dependent dehydrogenase (short-subunit alcohol dehydrogenase family)